jgi:hypothetical protein
MRYCALQYALADVQCARSSDFGKNDEIHSTRTHLGNVLKAGDVAWGCVTMHTCANRSGKHVSKSAFRFLA